MDLRTAWPANTPGTWHGACGKVAARARTVARPEESVAALRDTVKVPGVQNGILRNLVQPWVQLRERVSRRLSGGGRTGAAEEAEPRRRNPRRRC